MISFDLHKSYASKEDVRMTLKGECRTGEIIALYGPSGAGKSSLLRMLAGLTKPDKGQLIVDGETWFDSSTGLNLKVNKRDIGFLFQDFALFPNMTVLQNIKFGVDAKHDQEFIQRIIDAVSYTHLTLPTTLVV